MRKASIYTDGTKRNKKFEKLCLMTQEQLISYLMNKYPKAKKGDGYIYMEGTLPIILTAHMDTVHKETPKEIFYKEGKISSPQGIGGDDRCGVYMIMEIIKEFPCHVLFFEDEEIGGKGSDKFTDSELCKSFEGKIKFCIDLDRMNSKDAVYYECDNTEFEDFITGFWKTSYGSFTDICHICPALDCAGVNLSCGYYKQHTTEEYVVLEEMETAIKEVKKLLERAKDVKRFEWVEAKRDWYSNYYSNYYSQFNKFNYSTNYTSDYAYDNFFVMYLTEHGEEVEFINARSEEEALGIFFMNNPTLCYNDVVDTGYEDDYWNYYDVYGKGVK